MSRCAKFHHLYDEVGNFCGMSRQSISYYKAYREIVRKLVGQGLDEDFVFENFAEGPGRIISSLKDDETRTKALNYVSGRLHEKEKITESDLKASIKVWQGKDTCTTDHSTRSEMSTNVDNAVQIEPEIPAAPIAQTLKERYGNTVSDIPPKSAEGPPKPKPVPCLSGEVCKHEKKTELGRKCDMINQFLNQLPGGKCPFDLKEEKARKDLEFVTAAQMIKGPPLKVIPVQLTKQEAEDRINAVVRGYFTPKDKNLVDMLLGTGELGETYLDLFQALILEAAGRMA